MSFDRFLLAVESRDLSQADKSIIRVSSLPKLFLNDKIYGYTKKTYGTWKFGKIDDLLKCVCYFVNALFFGITVNFIIQKQLWERRHSYNTFVSLR